MICGKFGMGEVGCWMLVAGYWMGEAPGRGLRCGDCGAERSSKSGRVQANPTKSKQIQARVFRRGGLYRNGAPIGPRQRRAHGRVRAEHFPAFVRLFSVAKKITGGNGKAGV